MSDGTKSITAEEAKEAVAGSDAVVGFQMIDADAQEYACGTDVATVSEALDKAAEEAAKGKTTILVLKIVPAETEASEEPAGGEA